MSIMFQLRYVFLIGVNSSKVSGKRVAQAEHHSKCDRGDGAVGSARHSYIMIMEHQRGIKSQKENGDPKKKRQEKKINSDVWPFISKRGKESCKRFAQGN